MIKYWLNIKLLQLVLQDWLKNNTKKINIPQAAFR